MKCVKCGSENIAVRCDNPTGIFYEELSCKCENCHHTWNVDSRVVAEED